MQFLNPLFLLGAAAIGLPIFLHLFRKETTNTLRLPSLMFLRRLPIKETRRRKLRYLLLLAMRCLALILLALAFARPVVTGAWLNRVNPLSAQSVAIVLDRSMSVSQTAAWQRALDAAQAKIDSLGEGDEALLIQFGDAVEVLSPWESNPAKLRETLAAMVQPSFESTAFAEALRLASEQFEEASNARKEIYLITDLQRTGLSLGWKAPPEILVEVENVGSPASNLYVQQVRLDREVYGDRYPNPVLVRLATSPAASVKGEVQLHLNGQLIARESYDTGESGSALVSFKPFELEEGLNRGKVVAVFDDALPADNTYAFVLERKDPRTIALVSEKQSADSAFYLQRALGAGENLPYQAKVFASADKVELNAAQTPLVIFNDLREPPSASALQAYLESGGGVIMTLGKRARADRYNRALGDLLPVRLVEKTFVKSASRPFTSMTEISWEHSVFSVFRDTYRTGVTGTQFFGYWSIEPKEDAVVLARFAEGAPALVETPPESPGRLMVFTSSAGSTWSDFPLRSAYVPFWQAASDYASRWSALQAASRIGQALGLSDWIESQDGQDRGVAVLDPQGRRLLGLDEERPDFVRLSVPGHYEIRSNKRTDWIAANPSPEESDLEAVPLSDFQVAFVPQASRVESQIAGREETAAKEQQQGLWWLFLAAAAMLFSIETLLSNSSYARQAAQ